MISTHTPLAGRDQYQHCLFPENLISTHTPLAGRDLSALRALLLLQDFYSHAPRGARPERFNRLRHIADFYSHAPRGARPATAKYPGSLGNISTHTPLAGRDKRQSLRTKLHGFLLTRPSRGATGMQSARILILSISTHTPLAGRDYTDL